MGVFLSDASHDLVILCKQGHSSLCQAEKMKKDQELPLDSGTKNDAVSF